MPQNWNLISDANPMQNSPEIRWICLNYYNRDIMLISQFQLSRILNRNDNFHICCSNGQQKC